MNYVMLFAPAGATILSFILWLHKNRVHDQRQLMENFNIIENSVIELTTEVREVKKYTEHLHDCIHDVRDRIDTLDERLWDHTKNNDCE